MNLHSTVSALALAAMLWSPCYRAAADGTDPEYLLGPDDVIEINVLNHAGLDKTLTVLSDGSVTYPWAGRLKASGRTPNALADDIRAVLEKTKNNVVVTVAVKESHSRRVRVVGAVRTPNGYDLKPHWRLLDLVAVAGGLSAKPARVSGRIIRRNGQAILLDLPAALAAPDTDANPALEPDDLVLLDETAAPRNRVQIVGQVNKPGAYDLEDDGISLLSLLSQAGNPTERAALTRAYVMRSGKEIPLNLRPALIEGNLADAAAKFKFQAGDVLFIPEVEKRVGVMGQVNKPGYYTLPETRDLTALDALSLAGGQSATGDLHKAGIIRWTDGKAQVIPIDVEQMLQKGNLAANLRLQPNDVLFIPSRGERRFRWTDILSPLSTLGWLGLRLL